MLKTEVPFKDRRDAGRLLAERLSEQGIASDGVILGIPRGGVIVAATTAEALGLALDVVVAHKIGAPGNPEFAIGAAAADGTTVIEPWAHDGGDVTDTFLRQEADRQVARAREREQRLRGSRPPMPLDGRTAVVIDDGIATGATVHVAILAARARGARSVLVATPVSAGDTLARLKRIADDAIALATPEPFVAVGLWYRQFEQVEDEEVEAILAQAAARAAQQAGKEAQDG